MELLEGQTLRHRIASKPLEIETVLELSIQIASALGVAHSRGIILRHTYDVESPFSESQLILKLDMGGPTSDGVDLSVLGNSGALSRFYNLGSKTCEFIVRDRTGLLEPVEFLNFVRYAETDHIPKLLACLLSPLDPSLSHASSLENHVHQHTQVREQNYADYPERLAPSGDVMAPEQVAENRDCQPEPNHEREHRQHIHKEVRETKASGKKHFHPPPSSFRRIPECGQVGTLSYLTAES